MPNGVAAQWVVDVFDLERAWLGAPASVRSNAANPVSLPR
jgi:hypothetical protein